MVQVKQPVKTEKPIHPQADMDVLLEKIKALEAAKEAAKKALVKRTKELQVDLVKYNQIVSAKLDNKIELAAWEVLSSKYPEWTQNVNPGIRRP